MWFELLIFSTPAQLTWWLLCVQREGILEVLIPVEILTVGVESIRGFWESDSDGFLVSP